MNDIKKSPQNIEAERSVLGSVFIDKDAIVKVAEILQPEYFYDPKHIVIFEALLEIYENRDPIDIITVPSYLKKKKLLKKAGNIDYLTDLINLTPTSSNVESYAKLVKEAAVRRELIKAAGEISALSFSEEKKLEDVLDVAEQKIFGVSQQGVRTDFVSIRSALEESFDLIDELYKNKGKLRGVPSGFKFLDNKLNGFRNSNLIIVAARPSVGKSSFAVNVAQYAAVKEGIPVGLFSLEMSCEELMIRMMAAQANIDGFKITSGRLSDNELAAYGDAAGVLADATMMIDDTPGISIMELRTKARRMQMEHGVKLIIVDYLQLMRGRTSDNRVQEVTEISWGLKALAKELNIPVIAVAQLNRSIEQRGTKVPQLSDLRESGSIEQDADVVMFLYRMDEEKRNEVMLSIAKHRGGPTGVIPFYFVGEKTQFFERPPQGMEE